MANEKYDDDKYYEVKLARPIKFAGSWLRPQAKHWIKGHAIKQLMNDSANAGAILVGKEIQPWR